jgi:hypothetical protein
MEELMIITKQVGEQMQEVMNGLRKMDEEAKKNNPSLDGWIKQVNPKTEHQE